jgi:hypothetical protein
MNEVYPPFVIRTTIQPFSAPTLRYGDWNQFVLIDRDGFAISITTGIRCDPFDRRNQQSMVAVLSAMRPLHKLGFVLSNIDPFFQIEISHLHLDLPCAETR